MSVLEVGDGVFEVLSTAGDTHLGGDDFDKVIVDHLAETFKSNEGIDLRQDKQALQRLTEAAEKAKVELSNATQSEINLPFITATPEGPKHLDLTLTPGQVRGTGLQADRSLRHACGAGAQGRQALLRRAGRDS